MSLTEIQAALLLNLLDRKHVVDYACQSLLEGTDTPKLRLLAGVDEDINEEELKKILEDLFDEMGLEKMTNKKKAGIILAKQIARQILEEKINPYFGAKQIWNIWNISDRPKELTSFVNDADDYEDSMKKDEKILDNIVLESNILINKSNLPT